MERLTTYEPCEGGIPFVTVKNEQDALQRLATYEDTGLEPEEIRQKLRKLRHYEDLFDDEPYERWREIREAEAEGRLIVLPVEVGDMRPVVTCAECEFWGGEHISCEGFARCNTGESGIRYRKRYDFCSRGKKMEGNNA